MQKKKIGATIIMHPNHNNYGTSLQGFATIRTLDKLGYPYRIIRYKKKRTIREIIKTTPNLIRSGALKELKTQVFKKFDKIFRKEYARNIEIRTDIVNKFKSKHFDSISDYYVGYKNLCDGSKNYDVVFVGSDQVWGPLSLYSRFYNLLFVNPSIPQFSYASSFGVSNIFSWQKKGISEYLDKMDLIGVREAHGKVIVDSLSKNKATVVADPTLLLTKNEWSEYITESKYEINEPYILSYVLGSRKDIREEIMNLGKRLNMKVVSFRHLDWFEANDKDFGDLPIYDADPLDFVKLLKNANFVCTDSFHGTIFSIIFQKKFLTFYRQIPTKSGSTHSRIDSLLNKFNLLNRLYKGGDSLKQINMEIDFEYVEKELQIFRNDSIQFFQKGLELYRY